ncbi:MAG TPA: hypothetical protein VMD30_01790 [Tepidisphaeraceae bacterium]|nr:hypothetical protein [Tepidisphaeraceae bacterium]
MRSRSVLFLLAASALVAGFLWNRPLLKRGCKRRLLGRNKNWIAQSLGQPLTIAPVSDTWYYPLDARRRRALAIQFQRDVATAVQVIGPDTV